mgnify:CR=1 FL=1
MSCEKPTDIEFPTAEQRLVVQSNFSPHQPVEVFVSQSESLSTSNNGTRSEAGGKTLGGNFFIL